MARLDGMDKAKTRPLVPKDRAMDNDGQPNYDLPVVMTVEETAKFLRMNRKTIYDAISANQIPHLKIGRRLVVLRDALLSSLQAECACCQQPKGDGPWQP